MEIQHNLQRIVTFLSREIGPRSYSEIESLDKTADFIAEELRRYGYDVSFQPFQCRGNTYKNIQAEVKGRDTPEKSLILGAHYDTVAGSPGADDNAGGIAGMLEIARLARGISFEKTVRFVAFTLEEPPFFRSGKMGSYVYAKGLKEKGEILEGMICLESIGYFTDRPKSQYFPISLFKWIYPEKGNFIALVSNFHSKEFLSCVKEAFIKGADLPVESLTSFSIVPGVDFSDHASFWEFGYRAVMVTDTAFYRNPHYHRISDTPETLDYARMVEVVKGLRAAVEVLAGAKQTSSSM